MINAWAGGIDTEQAIRIIETTSTAINSAKEPTNYWWLLSIAVIPVIIGVYLKGKK